MNDRLQPILEAKRAHVEKRKRDVPLAELQRRADAMPPGRKFREALRIKLRTAPYALIAEIKKASPSKGVIRPDFDPRALALAYHEGGAACLSVLTDEPYFQGRDEDLIAVRETVDLPLLRKDFIVDEYQIYESRCLGADCILLIMATLSDAEARAFKTTAEALGMDALVEVHDRAELERALHLAPRLVGINNRNLKTLQVDIRTSVALAALLPDSVLGVAESGLAKPEDLRMMKEAGISTFLIGESLLRHEDVKSAIKTLIG